jgi:hypothetical protein
LKGFDEGRDTGKNKMSSMPNVVFNAKNAKKCPKVPKNAQKCQKMPENAQKCQKMPKMPEPKCLKCQLSRPSIIYIYGL